MTEIRFVTREIGSLAKPGWRVKAIAGRPVEEKDVEEAREWGWRLSDRLRGARRDPPQRRKFH